MRARVRYNPHVSRKAKPLGIESFNLGGRWFNIWGEKFVSSAYIVSHKICTKNTRVPELGLNDQLENT